MKMKNSTELLHNKLQSKYKN